MNSKQLWENFLKTGSVRDYLIYKKARQSQGDNSQELSEEIAPDDVPFEKDS